MPPVLTAAEMRELDRVTIEELGLPGAVLMENAGRALAEEVADNAEAGARIAILCGSGNNGGDGYVAGRWLREWGYDVCVYLAKGAPREGGDAALHLGVYRAAGGPVEDLATSESLAEHAGEIAAADVIVDALLGTGLSSEVTGHLAQLIAVINGSPALVVAADIPSGLSSDTGAILGTAVDADITVTFGFAKVGLVTMPGAERVGDLTVAEIGIPAQLAARAHVTFLDDSEVAPLLPPRAPNTHKGTFGHLLVVAGSAGKTGAALLTAGGALRAGAGLVTVAAPPDARALLEGRVPEAMTADLDPEHDQALSAFRKLAEGKAAVAFGPGMPTSEGARDLLCAALHAVDLPVVLDADALNHGVGQLEVVAARKAATILTPHPGEAARLLGATTGEIQSDRAGRARELAHRAKATIVLKGARTVVANPEGRVAIVPTGNPGMATGGSGDVLTGVIGALLAQGLGAYDAACLGAYVHGRAGDLAADRLGETALLAGDLVATLGAAFVTLAEGH